jgi:hypothetical protein
MCASLSCPPTSQDDGPSRAGKKADGHIESYGIWRNCQRVRLDYFHRSQHNVFFPLDVGRHVQHDGTRLSVGSTYRGSDIGSDRFATANWLESSASRGHNRVLVEALQVMSILNRRVGGNKCW